MKNYLFAFLLFLPILTNAQQQQTRVLTLGTFHFDFPNKDFIQTENSDQIDVLKPGYQEEIKQIIEKLERFEPTIIFVECKSSKQPKLDSLYNSYKKGIYPLERDEIQQIGFRLAKNLNIQKLYCVDEWGEFNRQVDDALFGKDTIELKKFNQYYQKDADSTLKYNPETSFKEKGILAELIRLNTPENIEKSLGNYLVGPFKYESKEGDFFGVNFETGRWFNRNLKIFRNIQRINFTPEDRILVIYGAGHLNILNLLFNSSPEFDLVKTNQYLN
ncbi:DUF5694 domain-containing protein [Christiangramia aquimixticola]|uniref:DUF5694 domain-containing protein n=1 Tax=Christiangramia aquimixticola TaxID=1697558 RepID=UPI003AA7D748